MNRIVKKALALGKKKVVSPRVNVFETDICAVSEDSVVTYRLTLPPRKV